MKKYRISNGQIVDVSGNPVVLKGVNLVCKDRSLGYIFPDYKGIIAKIAELKMNVIRLGIFWDAIEPAPGVYDDSYLCKVKDIVSEADAHGVAVYLDMHQDLFSSLHEDGAPGWATLTNGAVYEKTELWSEAYLTCPAVQFSFDSFWENAIPKGSNIGLQDHFILMWKHVIEFFKDSENVIGVDVFNEPFPGTCSNSLMEQLLTTLALHLSENPDQLAAILGEAAADVSPENIGEVVMNIWLDNEKKATLLDFFSDKEEYKALVEPLAVSMLDFDGSVLSSFYQRMHDAIREVDKDIILFIEANYFCNTGIPSNVVPPKINGSLFDENVIYSPHGYDLLVDTNKYGTDCYNRLDVIFETHAAYAKRFNLPVLVGEWGCYPDGSEKHMKEAEHLIKKFEELNFSFTYYDYSDVFINNISRLCFK